MTDDSHLSPSLVVEKKGPKGVILNDETRTKMAIIRDSCRGKPNTMAILSDWLQGDGTGVSWESLFKKCKLSFHAEQKGWPSKEETTKKQFLIT